MLLRDVVETSAAVAATRSRNSKTASLAALLSRTVPQDLPVVAAYLAGAARQRRTGLGWRSLQTLPAAAVVPTLTVAEVDQVLDRLSRLEGVGSRSARTDAVEALFARATAPEQLFLRDLLLGNLRQGASDAALLEAVARAAGVPAAAVRRAAMFTPDSGEVAVAAATGGAAALAAFTLVPGRPIRPMLATSAPDVATALESASGPVYVDRKLDGIRVQVHRVGDEVRVFTRSLDQITDRLPEVVDAVRSLAATVIVLDGEAIALGPDGRPRAFQETAARTMSSHDVPTLRDRVPLTPFFFDLLHLDGEDLVDASAEQRFARLDAVVPPGLRAPRMQATSEAEATAFFADSLAAGHEGVVVKSPSAPYAAGRRGSGWIKVKPRHTLDLVVLAVEWGSGRRRGLLSNIHLGARDPDTDGFVPLGKTFKGMTDEMLAWQTERFLSLETHRDGHIVHVRPEQVVEIAFDGVQRSTRYRGGMTLRFARVLRYRDDKTSAEADTTDQVRRLLG